MRSSADRFSRRRRRSRRTRKFEGAIYVLTRDEGGRQKPFFTGYKPQFFFRTTDITGTITLPEGVEMVMPGDNVKFIGELLAPGRDE